MPLDVFGRNVVSLHHLLLSVDEFTPRFLSKYGAPAGSGGISSFG